MSLANLLLVLDIISLIGGYICEVVIDKKGLGIVLYVVSIFLLMLSLIPMGPILRDLKIRLEKKKIIFMNSFYRNKNSSNK